MASSDYSGLTGGTSVTEVLKSANTELQELRAHYRNVTQRIRRLRSVVNALGALGSEGDEQSLPESAVSGWSGVTASCKQVLGESRRHDKKIRSRNPDLRRACRIAMLETFEAVSPEEVHKRIVRRGSFCFADADSAMLSIIDELNALTYSGELSRIQVPSGVLWRRITPSDQTAPLLS